MPASAEPDAAHRGPRHVVLVGTTASGKSALAQAVARRDPRVEIVAVDSMQVYRGMDIGTAKPTAAEQAEVRHHLIDVADPHEDYAVARYQRDCYAVLADIEARGHVALLVGGTGLYVQAVVDDLDIPGQYPEVRDALRAEVAAGGPQAVAALHRRLTALDPVAAARIVPTNDRRTIRALEVTVGSGRPFSSYGPGLPEHRRAQRPRFVQFGVARDPAEVAARIEARYHQQLADGFLDEVRALAARPEGLSRTARQALGYRELLAHLEAGRPVRDCLDEAIVRTRQFARRQRAWFRRDHRITWLDLTAEAAADPAAGPASDPASDPAAQRAQGRSDSAAATARAQAAIEDALQAALQVRD